MDHARACFAIATELSGAAVSFGPAPLSLDGLAMRRDLVTLAVSAAIEEDSAAWRRLGRLTTADLREVVSAARGLVGEAKAQLFAPAASAA